MSSSINASLTTGINITSDTSGIINLQSGGTTVATISSTGVTLQGLTVGLGAGAGAFNTAVGVSALTGGNYSVGVGYQAGYVNVANVGVYVGYQAGFSNTSGAGNNFIGRTAGYTNTIGTYNAFVGDSAGYYATGSNNVALGASAYAQSATASGSYNTALGSFALYSNTTASNNTAVGYQAGTTNITGTQNAFLGYQSGLLVTGNNNTSIGANAGSAATIGNNNVFIGTYAGAPTVGGSDNICIGYGSNTSGASVTGEMVIGCYQATGKGASTAFIYAGVGGAQSIYNGGNTTAWQTTSDQRLKKNIVDNNEGLAIITAIQVRNFEYRLPEEVTELEEHSAIQSKGVQLGVIAQELQVILPECVKEESTGVLSVDSSNLTWYLINAIKELKAEIDLLKGAK